MTQTRRERLHESTREEIKQVARQQIAGQGAPALSLRAIARQMGLTAPALYRYYASRDDLVTALIVDAYNALADALEAACAVHPTEAYAARFLAFCLTYREWAVNHPQDYALIFGTPIPGYVGPVEIVVPAASRTMYLLLTLLESARQADRLQPPPEYTPLSPELEARLVNWQQRYDVRPAPPVLHIALVGWGLVHGLVTLELFHHLQPMVGDPGELYRFEMEALVKRLGL